MATESRSGYAWVALAIFLGLTALGYLISNSAVTIRRAERTVTVKGLSEREVPADQAIWPIKFAEADNDLLALYRSVEKNSATVVDFLKENGFAEQEISTVPPTIVDRLAEGYSSAEQIRFRYSANAIVTVYSTKVDLVRRTMQKMVELGKKGIAMAGENYDTKAEFLFGNLNQIKPAMIEEATRNARDVAEKFATDSQSRLGKIREAQQGQFSIDNRDSTTPHIKRVRVVSTVVYYLVD